MIRLSISCEPHPTMQFAAQELRRYLQLAWPEAAFPAEGGLPIRLESRELSALDDGYQVRVGPDGGAFIGNNRRSVLLAVYDYLRQLGFRFLLPGQEHTFVPERLPEQALYRSFRRTPPLRHRGVCIEGADSLENVLDMVDWLPKLGFNAFFLQFKEPYFFLERWYDHVNNPTLPAENRSQAFYQDCYEQIHRAMALRGLLDHRVGHGFTAEALGYPSIGWIPVQEEPDDQTRQLIALVNGRRTLTQQLPLNTNLCYSNPEAVDRFCTAVLRYVRQHPQVDYVHVWLADDVNHICECSRCRRTTPTDQYVRILNEIDARLTAAGSACRIVFLLYQELLYPPQRERLHNPERFVLLFAPISRSFEASYPERPRPQPLPPYRRNQMTLPRDIQENLSYLLAWQEQFQGDSLVYDYPLGKAHYGDLGYQRISACIAQDIRRLKGLGLNGYMSCQELRAFLPTGFPNYVMGYFLLDEQLSLEQLRREYFRAAYGRDFETALAYLDGVSQRCSLDYFTGAGERMDPAVAARYEDLTAFTEGFMETLDTCLEAADGEPGPNAALHRRFWRLLRYHADYCIALSRALAALARGDPGADNAYDRFCALVQARELEWQPYLDVYRVQEVTGKYTGFHGGSTLFHL